MEEIGIKMVPFKFLVYLPDENRYIPIDEIEKDTNYKTVSGTELRDLLDKGKDIPSWFTYSEVANELQKSRPPVSKRGFTVFFTGLSGSGKSTLANGLLVKLLEQGSRPVTLLDGDIIRTHLSSELGFSKEHRSINVKRIGYVASEITKNGGIAVCAPIAPYESDRNYNRKLISKLGGYIEVHVATSLEKCEERDVKGLYKLAREGKLKEFTGISDPYEDPIKAELKIDSSGVEPEKLVEKIYNYISNKYETIYDDKKDNAGVKFSRMDLIGIPHQIIIGNKSKSDNEIEYKNISYLLFVGWAIKHLSIMTIVNS